jgi:hypothetical protein
LTDAGVRYFSGTATYRTTVNLTGSQLAEKSSLWLDLGEVHEVAAVRINGKPAAILWKAAYSCRADPLLHAGENTIKVDVTNLWPNRLIGDAQLPNARHYTRTNLSRSIRSVRSLTSTKVRRPGGSFTEYYAIDFIDDIVLMGHDGPGHAGIAEGKTKVRSLQVYHGKIGHGLSVEMRVKAGPVTLYRRGVQRARIHVAVCGGANCGGANFGDRKHQQPLPLFHRCSKLRQSLEPTGARAPLRCRGWTHRRQT